MINPLPADRDRDRLDATRQRCSDALLRPAHKGHPEPLDTSRLGPVRFEPGLRLRRLECALRVLERHRNAGGARHTSEERERWILDAMLAFSDEERRERL